MFTHLLKHNPQSEVESEPLSPVMKAMGYTLPDLCANRAGNMSESQQKRLKRHGWQYTLWILLALLMMPIFGAPLIERSLRVIVGLQDLFSLTMVLYILLALAPVIPLLWAMRKHAEVREDISEGKVAMLNGRVIVSVQGKRYTLILDANRFDVSRQVVAAFIDHEAYRLYIAPRTGVLLGAEEASR